MFINKENSTNLLSKFLIQMSQTIQTIQNVRTNPIPVILWTNDMLLQNRNLSTSIKYFNYFVLRIICRIGSGSGMFFLDLKNGKF